MKKKLLLSVLFAVLVIAFANAHSRSEVVNYVTRYQTAATHFVNYMNAVMKGNDKYVESNYQKYLTEFKVLDAQLNYYKDEFTDSDLDKMLRASEKISVAYAKFEAWLMANLY